MPGRTGSVRGNCGSVRESKELMENREWQWSARDIGKIQGSGELQRKVAEKFGMSGEIGNAQGTGIIKGNREFQGNFRVNWNCQGNWECQVRHGVLKENG